MRFLKERLVRSGRKDFDLFQQQDPSEILSTIIDKLWSKLVNTLNILKTWVRGTITCPACFQTSWKKEALTLLHLPLPSSVQSSLNVSLTLNIWQLKISFFVTFTSNYSVFLDHVIIETGNYCNYWSFIWKFLGINMSQKMFKMLLCTRVGCPFVCTWWNNPSHSHYVAHIKTSSELMTN